MKKYFLLILSLAFAVSCNSDEFTYEDYEKQVVYFPFQYPFRTLSLGNDKLDNSMDKRGEFSVGVNIGGVWKENKRDWTFDLAIDNSLVADNLYNANDEKIEAMPSSYYSISELTGLKIKKGSLVGTTTVKMNDAFFNDPKSLKNIYVIPLKIISTDADEIVTGTPAIENPNIHDSKDWNSRARDKSYTLFGVKYVNPYHGKFLRRGRIDVTAPGGAKLDPIVIRTGEPERNQVVMLTTESMTKVLVNYAGNDNTGDSSMELTVDPQTNNVTVSAVDGSVVSVSGTGKWEYDGDAWGVDLDGTPTKRDVFRLEYTYTDNAGNTCSVKDTLVFRDRQIVFECVDPVIK